MSSAKKMIEKLKEEIKSTRSSVDNSYRYLVELFPLQQIITLEQHSTALKVIEKLMMLINTTSSVDEGIKIYLKTLSELVENYESENFKANVTSGREMLAYLMDLQGFTQKDLAKEIGGQSVVSKILKGERELNIRQIKSLAKKFKVSPEVFI